MGPSSVPTYVARVQLRGAVEENHVSNPKKTGEEVLGILTGRRSDHRSRWVGNVHATLRLPPYCKSLSARCCEGKKKRREEKEEEKEKCWKENLQSAKLSAIAASTRARLRFSSTTLSSLRRISSSSRALSSALAREPN